jgi:hypothetical protein
MFRLYSDLPVSPTAVFEVVLRVVTFVTETSTVTELSLITYVI